MSAKSKEIIHPLCFESGSKTGASAVATYFNDPAIRKVVEFFDNKGLKKLKEEDQSERWYADWVTYQGENKIFASLLSTKAHSTLGHHFSVLKLTRFMEVIGYFSPAHGYSLQVSFLGIFPLLMSTNEVLKKEAVETLEKGGLFAFGLSEKEHGSDIYHNEFKITPAAGGYVGNGKKYYIGNANAASIISILGRCEADTGNDEKAKFMFFALRPSKSPALKNVEKIHTLGVKTAFVGGFEVDQHPFSQGDVISEKRAAWDGIFGTVNLGKFFLGFGSIGICEHALEEALNHTRSRILYGKSVLQMPHIKSAMSHASARLSGMKLYAYRSLDYLQASSADDRRYLLFNSVMKAKVSTQGVKVMEGLSECVGAKGFETETYFESALRDAQLIPGLEGSTHINYGISLQFLKNYFFQPDARLKSPGSLVLDESLDIENEYLMKAKTGGVKSVRFPHYLAAYTPLKGIANVHIFTAQIKAFRIFLLGFFAQASLRKEADVVMAMGKIFSTIAYAQLISENAHLLNVSEDLVSVVFHQLIEQLSREAVTLCGLPQINLVQRVLIKRMIQMPETEGSAITGILER